MLIVGLLSWCLVTGVLGALIAQSKNRSPLAGGLVGFIFNLLGLFVLAVLPKTEASRRPSDDELRRELEIRSR